MGVMAFDFNHLNNVLISRDYRKARARWPDGLVLSRFPDGLIA